jgi:cystathionine gamma-lyase/cystathionine gamma-lyase/homocysteine desulfhydrase
MKPISRSLHTTIDIEGAMPSVTPIFQVSGFEAGSPYFYSRKNNPNVAELEQAAATLESAPHAVAFPTGMSALAAVLDLLRPGDRLLVNRLVYGCSFRLFQRLAQRRGLELVVADLSQPEQLPDVEFAMAVLETPTNPFLRTVGIRRLADRLRARSPSVLIVVDNTWATPMYQHPLEHGADFSVHSCTKYLSGHTDVMGGIVMVDRPELRDELIDYRFYQGAVMDPNSAWLLRRSLQTLQVRLRAQGATTRLMRDFLEARPEVAEVYYPEIDGKQLTDYGGILFFRFAAAYRNAYSAFASSLKLFGTGTGMACVTSMVAQPFNGSHASMTEAEKQAIGLGQDLVRLCFGLEDPEDLELDLSRAFAALEPAEESVRGSSVASVLA